MRFEDLIENFWQDPNEVDLASPFLYFVSITDSDSDEYRYIGKARSESRLREYRRNMLKIRDGKERGKTQGYRGVHFSMFTALCNDWPISCIPFENCDNEKLNELEQLRIHEFKCNLNNARTWRVAQMSSLTLKYLIREIRT